MSTWSEGLPRPQLYSIEDVRSLFGWDRSSYYRFVREGRFPRPRRIAGKNVYTREDLDAYLLLAGRWEPGAFDDPEESQKPRRKGEDDES